jgi:xanthine/CO dehydrogenase XdhC/CoxF family maturation factor
MNGHPPGILRLGGKVEFFTTVRARAEWGRKWRGGVGLDVRQPNIERGKPCRGDCTLHIRMLTAANVVIDHPDTVNIRSGVSG